MRGKSLIPAVAGLALATVAVHAPAATLFSTSSDFTGWVSENNGTATTSVLDFDGATVNGAGNNPGNSGSTLGAGQTSPRGSLQLAYTNPSAAGQYTNIAGSPGEAFNPTFMAAIDPGSTAAYTAASNYGPGTTVAYSGTLYMLFTAPTNTGGTYFDVGINLRYDGSGYYNPNFSTNTTTVGTANGMTTYEASIPYTITAGNLQGFSVGVFINTNYAPATPFYVDAISTTPVSLASTPEPASLAMLGVGGLALLRRRQRA